MAKNAFGPGYSRLIRSLIGVPVSRFLRRVTMNAKQGAPPSLGPKAPGGGQRAEPKASARRGRLLPESPPWSRLGRN